MTRKQAKTAIFSLCYGSQAKTLAKQMGNTPAEAQAVLDNIHSNMPAIEQLKEKVWSYGRKHGFIRLLSGHVVHYPNLREHGYDRVEAERQSFNALIQGTQAALFKQAVLSIRQRLHELGALISFNVHDEIGFYAPIDKAEELCEYVTNTFSNLKFLKNVPLEGECHSGSNWYDAKNK